MPESSHGLHAGHEHDVRDARRPAPGAGAGRADREQARRQPGHAAARRTRLGAVQEVPDRPPPDRGRRPVATAARQRGRAARAGGADRRAGGGARRHRSAAGGYRRGRGRPGLRLPAVRRHRRRALGQAERAPGPRGGRRAAADRRLADPGAVAALRPGPRRAEPARRVAVHALAAGRGAPGGPRRDPRQVPAAAADRLPRAVGARLRRPGDLARGPRAGAPAHRPRGLGERHVSPRPGESRPAGHRSAGRRLGRALLVIATAQLMLVLDDTIVNVALPDMQHSLHIAAPHLNWVASFYALAFGGLLLAGGRAGALFGRLRMFRTGIIVFALASMAGGFAPDGTVLLTARIVQGCGAAIAAPGALSLLATTFPAGPARTRALGVYGAMAGLGSVAGLLLGGALTTYLSWRWVLFINVPIAVAVLAGTGVLVAGDREHGTLDVPGAVTATLGTGSLIYALTRGSTNGWTDPGTLASFAAAAVLLLPGTGMLAMFYLLTLYLQLVRGYSAIHTGLAYLPVVAGVSVAAGGLGPRLLAALPARAVIAA